LEWVIDQYRVSKDEHGNIVSDQTVWMMKSNIVRLIGSVITVSLETMKIVQALPKIKCYNPRWLPRIAGSGLTFHVSFLGHAPS